MRFKSSSFFLKKNGKLFFLFFYFSTAVFSAFEMRGGFMFGIRLKVILLFDIELTFRRIRVHSFELFILIFESDVNDEFLILFFFLLFRFGQISKITKKGV